MPVLKNARHERFAQEVAKGKSADEAYKAAGFSPARQNAHRLITKDDIRIRVREILARGAERAEITEEMVLRELAKIGFSDIRKAVKWRGDLVREEDNPDGGDVLVIKEIVTNHVQIISSDDIDDETAAAISEVSQTQHGLKIKLHDKRAALVDIGRHFGMFKDKVEHDVGGTLAALVEASMKSQKPSE